LGKGRKAAAVQPNGACLTLPVTARKSLKPRGNFGTGDAFGRIRHGPRLLAQAGGRKASTSRKAQSMAARSYLDWNATAPMRDEAKAAFAMAVSHAGNPSSVHAEGRAARALIESAREQVAALVGALPGNVFFTSSGTEANMLALTPAIETADEKRPRARLLL